MLGVLGLPPLGGRLRLVSAVALGVALAWRPNFFYWVPLLAAALARRDGRRRAAVYTGVALAALAAVTLPFYLTYPHDFPPLLTARKVRRYNDVLPKSGAVVLGSTGLLVLMLAFRELRGRGSLLRDCAVVQVVVLGFVVVLASIQAGKPDFSFLVIAYGMFFLFPGIFAIFSALARAP
jgi:uncharacterized membrane protein